MEDAEITYGSRVGRFVVVGELGSGGMGVVFSAHDRELDRKVALKVLRAAAATEEERMRMLREGQAMARITHPNVITVYEVGVEGNTVFLAQELLDDGTLGQWLGKTHSHAEILAKFVAAGRGLAAAHAAGLVHRDFKPDNVLLGKDGRVRVSDFGLARALGATADPLAATTRANGPSRAEDLSRSPMSPLTATGAVMGTPMFMAPEQHNGERADERSDQFSFCVALYYALHGDWPFGGKTAVALADNVIHGRIQPPPKTSRVPARLRKILARGLATDPAARFPSMDALLDALTHVPPRRMRRFAIAGALATVVAGAVIGGYALRSREDERTATTPIPGVDTGNVNAARATEWLASAMERDQLDDAFEKNDLAAALKLQTHEPAAAAIAWSAGVVALTLRGNLDQAKARLRDVEQHRGKDKLAAAYADLATAALAAARGDLTIAFERGDRCADAFAASSPVLASMCLELRGDAAAELGDAAAARKAYERGLALARTANNPARISMLELGLAALALDADKPEEAAKTATEVEAAASQRGAVTPDVRAWVVLARCRLAQAETQQALESLEHVKPERLQSFRIRIEHQIALGEVQALLGADGLPKIEEARAEAEKAGFVGLVLAARLARVDALTLTSQPEAANEKRALIREARAKGFARIAHLAETLAQP